MYNVLRYHKAHNLLGIESRSNYSENWPVVDQNQYLLLQAYCAITPTGLKFSNLGIFYYPSSFSFLLLKVSFL